jgi:hypothetical protein
MKARSIWHAAHFDNIVYLCACALGSAIAIGSNQVNDRSGNRERNRENNGGAGKRAAQSKAKAERRREQKRRSRFPMQTGLRRSRYLGKRGEDCHNLEKVAWD